MKLDQITALFPQASIQAEKPDKKYFAIPFNKSWLAIPQEEITNREKQIIQAILETESKKPLPKTPWFQYLKQNGEQPHFTGKIRFLFFKVKTNTLSINEWQSALKNMFNAPLLDSFSIDSDCYCFIEQVQVSSYSKEDFKGVLQTIDADLDSKTTLFIGHPWAKSELLRSYFNEELNVFNKEESQTITPVFSFSDIALNYFAKDQLKQSKLISYYKKEINKDKQLKDIIVSLFKNQGNISSTAKDLYLHRNTLTYHIDKANKQLGLDLKNINDLLLAYMSLI